MRIKTIAVIIIIVLLTIALLQNTDDIYFKFLWAKFRLPKLVVMTGVSVVAFILGVLAGRPARIEKLGDDYHEPGSGDKRTNTLSDEDNNYIN